MARQKASFSLPHKRQKNKLPIRSESQLFEDLSLFCIKPQKEGLDNKKEDGLQG
jgi:hypothetical protein